MTKSLFEFGRPLELQTTDPNSVRGRVLRNFFANFWHAQGNQDIDIRLSSLWVYRTRTTWDEQSQQALSKLGPLTAADMAELRLPGNHKDPRANVRNEFTRVWAMMNNRFVNPNFTKNFQKDNKVQTVIRELGGLMIKHDVGHLEKKRHFSTCGDPHESIYRTFAIQGRETGSEEFNWIYEQIRQEDGQQLTGELELAWERKHPDQTFFVTSPEPVYTA